ncbi:MAG: hypothetical protein ACFFDN_37205, partial [Candidatus Hodarchaeota archaeon]
MGIKVAIMYKKFKDRIFLYAGYSFISLGIPWIPAVLNFLATIFFDTIPPLELWFFILFVNNTIALIVFLFLNLLLYDLTPKTKRLIKIVYISFFIVITTFYVIIIFVDARLLGTLINPVQMDYSQISELYLLICVITAVALYIMLGRHFWKS